MDVRTIFGSFRAYIGELAASRRRCLRAVAFGTGLVALMLASAPARANPLLRMHGGPMRNLVIDLIFWGDFTDQDRRSVMDYVTLLSQYMTGTMGGEPKNLEAAVHYYGLSGILPGVWANDPNPIPPEVFPGQGTELGNASFAQQIASAQQGFWSFRTFDGTSAGTTLPRAPNRLVVVMTKGSNPFGNNDGPPPIISHPDVDVPAYHSDDNGLPWAAVMFDPSGPGTRDFMGLLSHEIIEAMTDPLTFEGWTTDEGFFGLTHNEICDACGTDTSMQWISNSGDDISGVSTMTINAAYGAPNNILPGSCQLWVPLQSTSMTAIFEPKLDGSNPIDLFYLTPKAKPLDFDPSGGHVMEVQWPSLFAHTGPTDWGQPFVPPSGSRTPPVWAVGKPSIVPGFALDDYRLFVRGSDNALWMLTLPSGQWTSLGGLFFGDPSAVRWNGQQTIHVFVVGTDDHLYAYGLDNTSLFGWAKVDNNVFIDSPKAISSKGVSTIDVFAVAESGGLGQLSYSISAGWSNLVGLSFTNRTPIAVASWASNRMDILATEEFGLQHKSWNGSSWSNPSTVPPGVFAGPVGVPALVTWGTGRLDAFAVNRQNELHHSIFASNFWQNDTAFTKVTNATGDPVVMTRGPNKLDVFYRTTAGTLTHLVYASKWVREDLTTLSIR